DRGNYWLNALRFDDAETRDRFLAETNAAGIQTRPCWRPLHQTAAHREAPRADDLAVTEATFARLANIPSSPWMMKR
ncbi:MAG: aminotransferase DegT, partial [Rhodospirillales bacterium]|nr:aminotransferase DegT [Rhodospirillales bacterium]